VAGFGPGSRSSTSRVATQIAGEVKVRPLQFIDKKDVKKMGVFIKCASQPQFAMDDSKLEVTPGTRRPWASSFGHRRVYDHRARAQGLHEGAPREILPFFIPSAIINLAAGRVSVASAPRG
jgi:3-oxoacyl-[acyl-carrier-protein] synthase II